MRSRGVPRAADSLSNERQEEMDEVVEGCPKAARQHKHAAALNAGIRLTHRAAERVRSAGNVHRPAAVNRVPRNLIAGRAGHGIAGVWRRRPEMSASSNRCLMRIASLTRPVDHDLAL